MARDRASIRIDLWADDDFRKLSLAAQHLYMLLLSHPTLSYAGVADWRVGRVAAVTAGHSVDGVQAAARELEIGRFILTDSETEEVLVRTFVKHDGLMKQPKLIVSMTNAYAAIASVKLRQVFAFEIQKLHANDKDLKWGVSQVQTILSAEAADIGTFTLGLTLDSTLSFTPETTPNDGQAQGLPTSTATTTSTKEISTRGTRVPDSFAITDEMREWAKTNVPLVNVDAKLPEFMDYWRGVAGAKGVKRDWIAAWRNGMRKQQEFAERDLAKTPAQPRSRTVDQLVADRARFAAEDEARWRAENGEAGHG